MRGAWDPGAPGSQARLASPCATATWLPLARQPAYRGVTSGRKFWLRLTAANCVHFLTITTQGDAAAFFSEVANGVEMNPPDIAGVVRVAAGHDIEFVM